MRRHTVRGYRYDIDSPLERLQGLENKLEEGMLLNVPCKIGATAYAVCEDLDVEGEWTIYDYEIKGICLKADGWHVLDDSGDLFKLGSEWAMLSRADAENLLLDRRMGI